VAVGVLKSTMLWTAMATLDELLEDMSADVCQPRPCLTKFYFVLTPQEIERLYGHWYDLSKPCEVKRMQTHAITIYTEAKINRKMARNWF
jgi:hypothetical protein